VRGVARALETVEVERRERIRRGDLVVDEDPASRRRHARQFRDDPLGMRDVVQRPARADEVEGPRLERQARRVAFDERDISRSLCTSALEQLVDDVDADDLTDERRECECERPGAGPDVERALFAARHHEGS